MITTIVLTGGPCGGKTKSLDYLQKRLSALGYIVFTIPESATEILNSGITREVCGGVFGLFFASTFWKKLQAKMEKSESPKRRKLQAFTVDSY